MSSKNSNFKKSSTNSIETTTNQHINSVIEPLLQHTAYASQQNMMLTTLAPYVATLRSTKQRSINGGNFSTGSTCQLRRQPQKYSNDLTPSNDK